MFVILVVALLPLGLIAMIATLQTTRTADLERRALLRVAAVESARSLSIELVGDMAALRTAAEELAADPANAEACARIRDILSTQRTDRVGFAIISGGRRLCGDGGIAPATPADGADIGARVQPDGLTLTIAADAGRVLATGRFSTPLLARVARPTMMLSDYTLELRGGDGSVALHTDGGGVFDRVDRLSVPVGFGELEVNMSLRRVPLTAPELVALIAPLLMWITAALIAWLVADRLLLTPLKRLRQDLVAYRPGGVFAPDRPGGRIARELEDLEDTFRRITQVVAEHEADLARGLERQTRLTREVHHRVKNNLQVITSLISLHARGTKGAEAMRAYSSIQRRVDALAVVHRNHFAELEVNRGLSLRAVLSELASNIRATAADGDRLSIGLEVEAIYVSQDTAVAVCFLATELIELAMRVRSDAKVVISAIGTGQPGRAALAFRSNGFVAGAEIGKRMEGSISRVIEGLSRQLRSSIIHDGEAGAFTIEIGYVARD